MKGIRLSGMVNVHSIDQSVATMGVTVHRSNEKRFAGKIQYKIHVDFYGFLL